MTPTSHEMDPPGNPGRFTVPAAPVLMRQLFGRMLLERVAQLDVSYTTPTSVQMTQPIEQRSPTDVTPIGVRIAATLAVLVGIVTVAVAVTTLGPAIPTDSGAVVLLVLGLVAGLGACAAGVLLWKRRRLGVMVLVVAAAIPLVAALVAGKSPQGNFMLFASLLLAAANWPKLR